MQQFFIGQGIQMQGPLSLALTCDLVPSTTTTSTMREFNDGYHVAMTVTEGFANQP
jgi:hypothetical protein